MSVDGDFWRFAGGELVRVEEQLSTPLSVADSWLVHNGYARSLNLHFERFSRWAAESELDRSTLENFFDAVLRSIPRTGSWFPRVEARFGQPRQDQLFFRLRVAPELTETLTLWTLSEPDPRTSPLIKGPDLSLCQQIRRAANLHGADEAILLDPDGYIADGALSALVWWRDGVLFGPDDSTNWIPSITRTEVFELASQGGYEVATERAKPDDLRDCEVWSLSSLQGIRGVTVWGDRVFAPPRLLHSFRKRLAMLSQPLDVWAARSV